MINPSAKRLSALLALLLASPICAVEVERPVSLEGVAPLRLEGLAPALGTEGLGVPSLEGLAVPDVAPALAPELAPEAALAVPAAVPQPAHVETSPELAPAFAPAVAPAVAAAVNGPAAAVSQAVGTKDFHQQIEALKAALGQNEKAGRAPDDVDGLDRLFFGRKHRGGGAVRVGKAGRDRQERGGREGRGSSESAVFVVNDEGVQISGRAAEDYNEVKRLEAEYAGRIDLSESLDVMDDAYSDAYGKLSVLKAVAGSRAVSDNAVRLENTLQRVDGIVDDRGRRVAVTTHQVFFHHASNPQSEIAEGIRRVDGYLRSAVGYFQPGGKADRQFGRLDEVVFGFDTRGYKEIKDHLRQKEKELQKTSRRPIRFVYLDEVAPVPHGKEETRAALNRLVKQYKTNPGLSELMGGVIHSRYTGLLLELRTLAHYHDAGYQILQSGREFFDAGGHYVTELDAVVRSPEGKTILVEAKSSRDKIPAEMVLRDKVEYKLRTYQARRAELEKWIGAPIDEVVFSFDVGRNAALKPYLDEEAESLSKKYGFPVSFLFIDSAPKGR